MSSPGGTPPAAPAPSSVTLVIKNPANNEGCADFSTEAPLALTVGALKLRIAREYEGHPPPNTQRLIFSGSLLRDDLAPLRDVLGANADLAAPQVLHLVVSQSNASTPGGSARPSPSPSPTTSVAFRRDGNDADRAATPPAPRPEPRPEPARADRDRDREPPAGEAREAREAPRGPRPLAPEQPGAARRPDPASAASAASASAASASAAGARAPDPAAPASDPGTGWTPVPPPSEWPPLSRAPPPAAAAAAAAGFLGYAGLGSPHARSVYDAAYAAAFAALSPGGSAPSSGSGPDPTASAASAVGVFGFPGSPAFDPFLDAAGRGLERVWGGEGYYGRGPSPSTREGYPGGGLFFSPPRGYDHEYFPAPPARRDAAASAWPSPATVRRHGAASNGDFEISRPGVASRPYYFNPRRGETTWDPPGGSDPPGGRGDAWDVVGAVPALPADAASDASAAMCDVYRNRATGELTTDPFSAAAAARDSARAALAPLANALGPRAAPEAEAALIAAARAIADGDPAAAAANAAAAAAGGRAVRVMQIRVDVKLVAKLVALVCFLGQGASREKLALYVLCAACAYLVNVGAFAGLANRLRERNPPGARVPARGGPAGVGPPERGAAAAGNEANGARRVFEGGGPGRERRGNGGGPRTRATLPGMRDGMPTTWFGEAKVLVCGFLASLLPSWEPPELHRHRAAPRAGGEGGGEARAHRD